jgi:hypothetical protein
VSRGLPGCVWAWGTVVLSGRRHAHASSLLDDPLGVSIAAVVRQEGRGIFVLAEGQGHSEAVERASGGLASLREHRPSPRRQRRSPASPAVVRRQASDAPQSLLGPPFPVPSPDNRQDPFRTAANRPAHGDAPSVREIYEEIRNTYGLGEGEMDSNGVYKWTMDGGSTLELSQSRIKLGWYDLHLSNWKLGREDN